MSIFKKEEISIIGKSFEEVVYNNFGDYYKLV